MKTWEAEGKVVYVGELKTFASGFTKRTLVVDVANDGAKWPELLVVDAIKDRCASLQGLSGRVRVEFGPSGREWTDPKTGATRYFCGLYLFSVMQLDGGAARGSEDAGSDAPQGGQETDEMPF